MMYCSNCGAKNDGNNYCIKCGNKLENTNNVNNNVMREESNGFKIASIVLGILGIIGSILIIFSPISFILSLVGLILGIVASKKVRNISGIVLNSIGLFLSIIIIVVMGLVINFVVDNEYEEIDRNKDNYAFDKGYYERFKNKIEEY